MKKIISTYILIAFSLISFSQVNKGATLIGLNGNYNQSKENLYTYSVYQPQNATTRFGSLNMGVGFTVLDGFILGGGIGIGYYSSSAGNNNIYINNKIINLETNFLLRYYIPLNGKLLPYVSSNIGVRMNRNSVEYTVDNTWYGGGNIDYYQNTILYLLGYFKPALGITYFANEIVGINAELYSYLLNIDQDLYIPGNPVNVGFNLGLSFFLNNKNISSEEVNF